MQRLQNLKKVFVITSYSIHYTKLYELSPAYIQGFEPIRDVDKDFKSLKEAGIWIVRNTKNRLNQAELIIDWIIRYIKVNDESSDIASIAFDNRSASSKGLVNITVSMLRAVGIPSRVVTGIKVSDEVKSYSWLEFYLPGGGWVPYDLLEKKVDRITSYNVCYTKLLRRLLNYF